MRVTQSFKMLAFLLVFMGASFWAVGQTVKPTPANADDLKIQYLESKANAAEPNSDSEMAEHEAIAEEAANLISGDGNVSEVTPVTEETPVVESPKDVEMDAYLQANGWFLFPGFEPTKDEETDLEAFENAKNNLSEVNPTLFNELFPEGH